MISVPDCLAVHNIICFPVGIQLQERTSWPGTRLKKARWLCPRLHLCCIFVSLSVNVPSSCLFLLVSVPVVVLYFLLVSHSPTVPLKVPMMFAPVSIFARHPLNALCHCVQLAPLPVPLLVLILSPRPLTTAYTHINSRIDEVGQERVGEGGSLRRDEANEMRLCG